MKFYALIGNSVTVNFKAKKGTRYFWSLLLIVKLFQAVVTIILVF